MTIRSVQLSPSRRPSARFFMMPHVSAVTLLVTCLVAGCAKNPPSEKSGSNVSVEVIYVDPSQSIQDALNNAAENGCRKVMVRPGVYRPATPSQALVYLNKKHDGIQLIADGNVTLTAHNPDIADKQSPTFPAVVNHVIYLGDGLNEETVIDGFRITGARGFETHEGTDEIQPDTGQEELAREQFFFSDGGGIKIFGRSYPVLRNLVVEDNFSDPCGGGVSVEHRGFRDSAVVFENCVFRSNSCRLTGPAVDLLQGSRAKLTNCLFVGNHGNNGVDDISEGDIKYNGKHGSGALTIFPESRVEVDRCTFVGNRNAVDDKGRGNVYKDCLFWQNTMPGGIPTGERYEMHIVHAVNVEGCHFNAANPDLIGSIDPSANTLQSADPKFDSNWIPVSNHLKGIGYRPVNALGKTPNTDNSSGGP